MHVINKNLGRHLSQEERALYKEIVKNNPITLTHTSLGSHFAYKPTFQSTETIVRNLNLYGLINITEAQITLTDQSKLIDDVQVSAANYLVAKKRMKQNSVFMEQALQLRNK